MVIRIYCLSLLFINNKNKRRLIRDDWEGIIRKTEDRIIKTPTPIKKSNSSVGIFYFTVLVQ